MSSISNEALQKEIEELSSNFPLNVRTDICLVLDYLNHYQLLQVKGIVETIAPKIQQRSRYNDPTLFDSLTKLLKEFGKTLTEKQKAQVRYNKRFKHNVKKA